LLEALVIPSKEQFKEAGTKDGYDRKFRCDLTVDVIKDLQDFGIEPDVGNWRGLRKFWIMKK